MQRVFLFFNIIGIYGKYFWLKHGNGLTNGYLFFIFYPTLHCTQRARKVSFFVFTRLGKVMNYQENERENFENELSPFIQEMGYELVEAVLEKRSKSINIRIAIYSPQGITINDCSRVSKALARDYALDDIYGDNYSLEVSSPGMGRRLKRLREYQVFCGKNIELFLKEEYNGEKKITGIIKGVSGDRIQIERENGENCLFSLEDISKGRLNDKFHF